MVQGRGILVIASKIVNHGYSRRVGCRKLFWNNITPIQLYVSLETMKDPLYWLQCNYCCSRIKAARDQGINSGVRANVENTLCVFDQSAPNLERCSLISITNPVQKEIGFHHVAPMLESKMMATVNLHGKRSLKTQVRGQTSRQSDSAAHHFENRSFTRN